MFFRFQLDEKAARILIHLNFYSIMNIKYAICLILTLNLIPQASGNQVTESQQKYVEQYSKKENTPKPSEMLLNTDAEPDLSTGFVSLYNGKNLDGWVQRGAKNKYEAKGDVIVGTYVPPNANSYLCTVRDDYADFIFTCELKWLLHGNTGIQFRSSLKGKKRCPRASS